MGDEKIRLDALALRSTLQIVICDPDKPSEIVAFGSAFLLSHEGHLFFVTADHNLHLDASGYQDGGQRNRKEYDIQIITNNVCKSDLSSINQPIGGFFYLTGYNCAELSNVDSAKAMPILTKLFENTIDVNDESLPLDIRIPVLPDMAVSEIKEPFEISLLSNEVIDADNTIVVEEGMPKLILETKHVANFDTQGVYIVGGTIQNKMKNTIVLDRKNVVHSFLKFERHDSEKNIILYTPEDSDITYWEGLSGAPVLDKRGLLAGMLIRVNPEEHELTVVPIRKIVWLLKNIILMRTCS